MIPPQGHNNSSRRRSLIKSVSRKLSVLDQSRPQKGRSSDEKANIKAKISSPFDFRDLSSGSSSASSTGASGLKPPTLKYSTLSKPEHNSSPLDKPLPSLPVATIISGSPVKARRSLIDAEEKPLRRSVSPGHRIFEDWPSLTPTKINTDSDIPLPQSGVKMPTNVKPSISEGLAERIKRLNLEDETEVKSVSAPNSASTGSVEISSPKQSLPQPIRLTSAVKSPIPTIRHTRTSELRMRLSAGNLGEQKSKKTASSSPLAVTSGNISARARSTKRIADTTRNLGATTRSRSRSRHRVTAQGSPYVLPAPEKSHSANKNVSNGSLILDPSRIDTNFGANDDILYDSQKFGCVTQPNEAGGERRSSLPIPKHRAAKREKCQSDVGININNIAGAEPVIEDTSNKHVTGATSETDIENNCVGNTRITTDNNSLMKSVGHPQEPVAYTNSETFVESTSSDRISQEIPLKQNVTTNAGSQAESQDGSNARDDFEIKNVSKMAPQHGPILRISPLADELLRGVGCCVERASDDVNVSKQANASGISDINLPDMHVMSNAHKRATGSHDLAMKESVEVMSSEITHGDDDSTTMRNSMVSNTHLIQRKPVSCAATSQRNPNIHHVTTTSAPPIKSGVPHDTSRTPAWPFNESAIAPFKTHTTPERNPKRTALDLTESKRSSATSSQSEPSPGRSVQSRYSVGEAIGRIQPSSRNMTKQAMLANTVADLNTRYVANVKSRSVTPRSAITTNNTVHPTKLRTPSAGVSFLNLKKAPPVDYPNSKFKSRPRTRYMESFSRTTNSLHSASIESYEFADKPPSSPYLAPSSVNTGKAVLHGIRGLFHKHSNLHIGAHRVSPAPQSGRAVDTSTEPPSSITHRATMPKYIPRSPQVKNTSTRKPTPHHFPSHKAVRPLATPSPGPANPRSPITRPNNLNINTNTIASATTTTPTSRSAPPNSPPELTTATSLIHDLLTLIQQDSPFLRRKEQLIELSKLMVSTLTAAREAETALEMAKQAALRCETRCAEVRKEVCRVEGLVRKILQG